MNKSVFLTIAVLLLQNVYGQQVAFFDMEPMHTLRKLKEYKQSPLVYSVSEKQIKFTTPGKKTRVLNKNYKEIETQIISLENDSIQKEESFQLRLNKFAKVSKIKVLINEFLGSTKPFEVKKSKLITAQKLAHANRINELIYADNSINTALKSKFFVLKLNKLDLKVHLKKVTWRLDQMNLVEPSRKPSTLLDTRLKDLRAKKSSLKQYNYIATKPTVSVKNILVTNQLLNSNLLEGTFKQVGAFYIIQNDYNKNLKKGQVVTPKLVAKLGLDKKGFVGPKQVLFQDAKSKKQYITESNFLERYAFSINGKFNAGINSDVVYSNGLSMNSK